MDDAARRRAMLEEMGLGPQWRLRAGVSTTVATAPTVPLDTPGMPAADGTVLQQRPATMDGAVIPAARQDAADRRPDAQAMVAAPDEETTRAPADLAAARADAPAGAARPSARAPEAVVAGPATADSPVPRALRTLEQGPLAGGATQGSGSPSPRAAGILGLDWDPLAAEVAGCTACSLARTRRCTVFGTGDRRARWMFVGEGPGAEEDATGQPFVGQAGRLLDSMLAALGMARDRDVYIANIVKCRPPGNRVPTAEEVAACEPFLHRQIALVRPSLIIALGKTAAVTLLGREQSIASMRGQVYRYRDTPLVVTYHPAYLLRNLPEKAKSWEDLCFARSLVRAAETGEGSGGESPAAAPGA